MLTSKQRAYLRSLANNIDTILIIGKGGITDNIICQAKDALKSREIIKAKVLETAYVDIKECASNIATATKSDIVHTIGNKFVLYKRNEKEPKILLPTKKR